jgi:ribosome-associated protein YbcJ (S4-like RNA binding protein)
VRERVDEKTTEKEIFVERYDMMNTREIVKGAGMKLRIMNNCDAINCEEESRRREKIKLKRYFWISLKMRMKAA